MTLATLDRITFFSSPDLKHWKKESEFGESVGAHGGVWECPDLFPLKHDGKDIWMLLVSINPGGPNGGSATQYFTGQFDGHTFTPYQTDTRWVDYGPDDYAGVTWSNTGNRRIFLGWMSNWDYAKEVPTEKWRSAMTIPRDLYVEKVGDKYYIRSAPSKELKIIEGGYAKLKKSETLDSSKSKVSKSKDVFDLHGGAVLRITATQIGDFWVTLSNDSSEKTVIGFDKVANQFYIDRKNSGKTQFQKDFAKKLVAPRIAVTYSNDITLVIEAASVELFADNGLTVMTCIFFPSKDYSELTLESKATFQEKTIDLIEMKSSDGR